MSLPCIIVTSGEPAGVGPELCIAAAERDWPCELVFTGDPGLFAERARQLGRTVQLATWREKAAPQRHRPGEMVVLEVPLQAPAVAGKLDSRNSRYVIEMLDRAVQGCLAGRIAAMVTAPVQKSIIADAGIAFAGHTEHLAGITGGTPVMLLVAGTLRVALATTHLPLSQVPGRLNTAMLLQTLKVLDQGLKAHFGLPAPRIAVCGLNPHAGEGGHLGDEDQQLIAPAIAAARERGIQASGPLPADTAFTPASLAATDAVLAMYHDQGLPVIKHASFGRTVNVTLGLPILRTSVDHGTALDLAGTGGANRGSLFEAITLAIRMSGG